MKSSLIKWLSNFQAVGHGFDPRLPLQVSTTCRPLSFNSTPFTPLMARSNLTLTASVDVFESRGTRAF